MGNNAQNNKDINIIMREINFVFMYLNKDCFNMF